MYKYEFFLNVVIHIIKDPLFIPSFPLESSIGLIKMIFESILNLVVSKLLILDTHVFIKIMILEFRFIIDNTKKNMHSCFSYLTKHSNM